MSKDVEHLLRYILVILCFFFSFGSFLFVSLVHFLTASWGGYFGVYILKFFTYSPDINHLPEYVW